MSWRWFKSWLTSSSCQSVADQAVITAWLADVLTDAAGIRCRSLPASAQDILVHAQRQGIRALVNARLRAWADSTGDAESPIGLGAVLSGFAAVARDDALASMLLEAETGRVLAKVRSQKTPMLLLKGSALAHWLYSAPHLRHVSDVDVLVDSQATALALANALAVDGYTITVPATEPIGYEVTCSKVVGANMHLEVDIHWRLANSALFARVFTFDELLEKARPLPGLGVNALGLGRVHALLHACIHRSLNLSTGWEDKLKWLYDLHLLMEGMAASEWDELVLLAADRKQAGVVLHGLLASVSRFGSRLPGRERERLKLAAAQEPLDASRVADWRYMQWATLRSLPSAYLKIHWLWQRLFLSRERLALLYRRDESYLSLLLLRARRMIGRVIR